jgi:hypothetical protein
MANYFRIKPRTSSFFSFKISLQTPVVSMRLNDVPCNSKSEPRILSHCQTLLALSYYIKYMVHVFDS